MKPLKAPGSVGNSCQGRDTPEGLQPTDDSGQAVALRNGVVGIMKDRDVYHLKLLCYGNSSTWLDELDRQSINYGESK